VPKSPTEPLHEKAKNQYVDPLFNVEVPVYCAEAHAPKEELKYNTALCMSPSVVFVDERDKLTSSESVFFPKK
jgi:hypothetical protein